MYIHIGDDRVVLSGEIIAVVDIKNKDESEVLSEAVANAKVQDPGSSDKMKSIIVTDNGPYLSPISTATLKQRAEGRGGYPADEESREPGGVGIGSI